MRLKRWLLLICVALCFSCKPSPKLLWKHQTGERIRSSPVVAGNRIVFGSGDSFVYALAPETGAEIWKRKLGILLHCRPLVEGNRIFLGTSTGDFTAIDASNGNILWNKSTGAYISYTACADENNLYFGNNAGRFYCVSKRGETLWEKSLGSTISGSCQVYQHLVYTSCWDKHFYALNSSDGQTVWAQTSGTLNFSGPAIANDTVYFSSHEHLFGFDARTGAERVRKETHYGNTVIASHGSLWTTDTTRLVRRNLKGDPVAEIHINERAGHPLVLDRLILLNGSLRSLYGISFDMKLLWKYQGKDSFPETGVVLKDVLYIGNTDGNLYAIRLPG